MCTCVAVRCAPGSETSPAAGSGPRPGGMAPAEASEAARAVACVRGGGGLRASSA
jgi:hypothetical protein